MTPAANPFATLPPDRPPVRTRERAKGSGKSRWATFNAFADASIGKLSRAEIAVWLLLFRDGKRNGLARTGQADLARRAGCNVGTVKRAIRVLIARGLLVVVRRGRLGLGPSVYRLHPTGSA